MTAPATAPHYAIALAKHAPPSGARVLDIGCGFGETTFDLARLVGPKGSVVGFDCSARSLGTARLDPQAPKTANVSFVVSDAEHYAFEDELSGFDMVFSRFGTLSCEAPAAALRNVRSALRPGGRLLLVTWPLPTATPDLVRPVLERAGYVDVAVEAITPRCAGTRPSSWCITATNPT
jgi:ubiquinone/menaquinone biosynthesis C-methylase UbiE